jgi:dinuclear metal center YbgI/SA1388 family protein
MRIEDIINELESHAPKDFQEPYDNSGLLTGDKSKIVTGVLLTLDCTEEVVEEAINLGLNLIVAHHPIIFTGLKKITGADYVQRTIIKAIKNDISIYACHTNLDNIIAGVNKKIADKLGLRDNTILDPKKGMLRKIITYAPESHRETILTALFDAGAGKIGNYDSCSFVSQGIGTFKGNESSIPYIGKAGELSTEKEIKIESVFEVHNENKIISALLDAHPYEEVAYNVLSLENKYNNIGSGMIGLLPQEMVEKEFLVHVKSTFKVPFVKHTKLTGKLIKKVAICGGSGQFLLQKAISKGADAFISADFKYHEFFDADNKLLLIDTGHYESEQFTPEIFYEFILKKFNTFAIHLSKINTNPINYF